ncbi:MAG TPA: hypothetical protein VIK18_13765 [Pirellulales bacterium]
MPCDTWRDEFDRLVANLARDHVHVAEPSRQAFIVWLTDANEAAKRDAATAAAARFAGDWTVPGATSPENGPGSDAPPATGLPPRLEKLLREIDLLGAAIAVRRGEWFSAILSIGSAVFLAGIALGVAKIIKRLHKLGRIIAGLKGPARVILSQFVAALTTAIENIPLTSSRAALAGLKRFIARLRPCDAR